MKTFLSFLIICCTILNVFGANKHIRKLATGSGTGDDWINAYTDPPATLARDTIYYFADNDGGALYCATGYKIDDAVSGTQLITWKKATEGEHGSSVGWNSLYGDGIADFGQPLKVCANYIVLDGVTGGGPNDWRGIYGFRSIANWGPSFIMLSDANGGPADRVNVNNVWIKHWEIASPNPPVAGLGTAINATALGASFTNINLSYLHVHDIGGQNFYFINMTGLTMEYCYVTRNETSPAMHGNVVAFNQGKNATIRYNWFEDSVGTGCIGFYTGSPAMDNAQIYGNIFSHHSGFGGNYGNGAIYGISAGGTTINSEFYNNTFVNLPVNIVWFPSGSSGNTFYNNLVYQLDGAAPFIDATHNWNWFADPDGTFGEVNGQNGVSNPFVDWVNGNFYLTSDTTSGTPTAFTSDMFGNTFSSNGGWTRGAIAYLSGGVVPNPPSGLTVTPVNTGELLISWTDNSSNETGFKLERSSTGGGSGFTEIIQLAANTTSYNNVGLTSGTTYHYRIRAFNGIGNSSYSSEANGTTGTKPPIILNAPGIVYIYGTGIGHISP